MKITDYSHKKIIGKQLNTVYEKLIIHAAATLNPGIRSQIQWTARRRIPR